MIEPEKRKLNFFEKGELLSEVPRELKEGQIVVFGLELCGGIYPYLGVLQKIEGQIVVYVFGCKAGEKWSFTVVRRTASSIMEAVRLWLELAQELDEKLDLPIIMFREGLLEALSKIAKQLEKVIDELSRRNFITISRVLPDPSLN